MASPHLGSRDERRSSPRRPPSLDRAGPRLQPWSWRLPDEEWHLYQRVVHEARSSGIRFAFGGAFATAVYTGELRNTKDFDFYILPEDREQMQEATARAGLRDHYDLLPYDRSWIYRASKDGVLVDAIWAMANHRATVDDEWLTRGPLVDIQGEQLRAIPIEELIWSKLYVLQRQRTDWGDVLNLFSAQAESIDWDHLANRLGSDAPLLTAALAVWTWLEPERGGTVEAIRNRLASAPSDPEQPETTRFRAGLIDSRPWFRSSRT
jgi:hypothetical protein